MTVPDRCHIPKMIIRVWSELTFSLCALNPKGKVCIIGYECTRRNVDLIMKCVSSGMSPGGTVHNMLRVWLCAAHMGGFWAQNSLNNSLFPYSPDFP